MCHHLALLDIRLRYPHVVFVGLCPDLEDAGMRGRARIDQKEEGKQTARSALRIRQYGWAPVVNNKQRRGIVCARRCENRQRM
jgi:hypothetical protein